MARTTGPTVARWHLGKELSRLRSAKGLGYADVAEELGCSESKVRKIESGALKPTRSDLLVLLNLLGIEDAETRESLLEYQKLGNRRGWWTELGPIATSLATLVSLEASATSIRQFEPLLVPGLLQTEDYAKAVMESYPDPDVEQGIRLRLGRQAQVFDDDPARYWAIVDEAAMRRRVGDTKVMRAQLERLLAVDSPHGLQVLPFSQGVHPGMTGALTIMEFDDEVHSPVVYVDCQAGNLFLEKSAQLRTANLIYNQLTALALSPADSASFIAELIKEL